MDQEHHKHGLPVPTVPDWTHKFFTAPDWPYSDLGIFPRIGYTLGDWRSHVVLTEDDDGIWAFTICRSCGRPWFEYVPWNAPWPCESFCGGHRK
jgi:hypothetical protein